MAHTMKYAPIQSFYAGKAQPPTSDQTFQTFDPSTASPLAIVHKASQTDIDAAVKSADEAFPVWSTMPVMERARILLRAVSLLRQRNQELAVMETHDTGKPLNETSTVDIATGADVLEFFAGLISSGGLNGETTQLRDDAWVYTRKEPIGVCAGIGAWNYPIQIALWKSAPCLAAGNCMVYKPSEFTPLHANVLAALYIEAGLPSGVFNVVHGDGIAVGSHLVEHPQIAKVSFTGQVSTGRKVASSAALGMKYVTMELGGKSPLLILPDADVECAVDGAMMANFFSSGQVCTNGTRVFIPEEMKTKFEKRLLQKMEYVRMGPPMESNTNFGPLISASHLKKVTEYIKHGKEIDMANLIYDGDTSHQRISKAAQADYSKGYWCPPVIFTDCQDNMKIVKDEIFGPVMCILPYSSSDSTYLEKLLERANNTPLGLAAGVFTRDLTLAHRVTAKLQAGITWINTWGESPAEMSVGGWKLSGLGVENGRKGLEMWIRNKSTLVEMGGVVATAFEPLRERL